jgi:hypothetical protein
MEKIKRAE